MFAKVVMNYPPSLILLNFWFVNLASHKIPSTVYCEFNVVGNKLEINPHLYAAEFWLSGRD